MELNFKKLPFSDKITVSVCYILLFTFVFLIILPLGYIIIASFMDPNYLRSSGITFDITEWSLDGYRRVLDNAMLWRTVFNSFLYSFSFAFVSLIVCLLAAYPMSKKEFVGRKIFNTLFIITMFFGGGLMPTYLLVSNLGMLDSIWAIILPNAVNVWNIILIRTYYKSLPGELRESSALDGASDLLHFIKILMPLCKPIIAVIFLWQFVGMWNSYFDALIYLESSEKQPLQLLLRSILIQNTPDSAMVSDIESFMEKALIAELLKYSTIIISSLPLLIMYPFFQKYFEKGMMVGSIKG